MTGNRQRQPDLRGLGDLLHTHSLWSGSQSPLCDLGKVISSPRASLCPSVQWEPSLGCPPWPCDFLLPRSGSSLTLGACSEAASFLGLVSGCLEKQPVCLRVTAPSSLFALALWDRDSIPASFSIQPATWKHTELTAGRNWGL